MTEQRVTTTLNTADPEAETFSFGWARGTRNRAAGTVTLQCWGCGGAMTMPDVSFMELHFQHATTDCSYRQAMENHARGFMPRPSGKKN